METLCGAFPEAMSDDSSEESSSDGDVSLFQEMDEALDMCTLVYTLTMLRRLVREGKVDRDADAIMKLPLSIQEADSLVLTQRHHLTLSKHAENKRIFTNIVKTLNDRKYYSAKDKSTRKSAAKSPRSVADEIENVSSCFIIAFGGETSSNALKYAISVNHERRVVTLCFRGAETDIDWASLNTEVCMKEFPNPMKRHPSQSQTVKIHNQLHELLVAPSLRDTNTTWTTISEYQEILEEHVIPILMEHRGYKLHVTGHSLGGALATVFAFLAAAEPDTMVPRPVTCISVGSSYVGDKTFRAAHQLLEGLRKLRHVRISNHKDSVTLSPKISSLWKLTDKQGHSGTAFKHVGLNLRFYPGKTPFEVSYPSVRHNFVATGLDEITRAWDNSVLTNFSFDPGNYITWPLHQIREYNKRVMQSREMLESTTLSCLYMDPLIVGDLFSHLDK
jgi:hypothetical protein